MDIRVTLDSMSFLCIKNDAEITHGGLDDRAQSLLADREEDMTAPGGPACVNSNSDASISRVLETSRH